MEKSPADCEGGRMQTVSVRPIPSSRLPDDHASAHITRRTFLHSIVIAIVTYVEKCVLLHPGRSGTAEQSRKKYSLCLHAAPKMLNPEIRIKASARKGSLSINKKANLPMTGSSPEDWPSMKEHPDQQRC